MNPQQPISACRAAIVPIDGLRALASLRHQRELRVVVGEQAWVEWYEERPDVVAALIAAPGVEFLERRGAQWFSLGHHLPACDIPPIGEAVPIDRALVPAAFEPIAPDNRDAKRVPLVLVRCDIPRSTTAMRCSIGSLQSWADSATTTEIAEVQATRNESTAWLRGTKLPAIVDAERFWGERVWRPIGWRTEPDCPESALREAAAVGPNEILVLMNDGAQAIPVDAFRSLTRAAIRLASV